MKRKKIAILCMMTAMGLCACKSTLGAPEVSQEVAGETGEEGTDLIQNGDLQESMESREDEKEQKEEKLQEEIEEKENGMDKKYQMMLNSSTLSTGNNYRLKKVIEKARNQEEIKIVTLGGSVTEGALAEPRSKGYAYLFAEDFEKTYGGKVTFVDAGLSGTPSSLGVMRYEKDVLEPLGSTPDILVIEYAVNDWQEVTTSRGYESLIYQALNDNPECAVILMFALSSKKWSLQSELAPYGYYYDLPMVSMEGAFKMPAITDEEYFSDEFHPTNAGHQVMADCLKTLLLKVDGQEMDAPADIPKEAKNGRDFTHMKLVLEENEKVRIAKGSFDKKDKEVQTCVFTDAISFPDNFYHDGTEGADSLKMVIKCKTILLDFKTSGSTTFGEAEILLDGEVVKTVNGYVQGGWNSSNVILVLDEKEVKEHTLEVRMVKGQEEKKFTVLAVAYN